MYSDFGFCVKNSKKKIERDIEGEFIKIWRLASKAVQTNKIWGRVIPVYIDSIDISKFRCFRGNSSTKMYYLDLGGDSCAPIFTVQNCFRIVKTRYPEASRLAKTEKKKIN